MTYIKPCRGCPLSHGCEQRDEFRCRVRALGGLARTVRFKCPKLAAEIRPGRRVIIGQPYMAPGSAYYEDRLTTELLPATIALAYSDHSFTAVVDANPFMAMFEKQIDTTDRDLWERRRFRKRQNHSRIVRFLDEPDWPITSCGNVGSIGACDSRTGWCECQAEERLAKSMAREWY